MENNEKVIVRVYQEKESMWEREMRRMKNVNENRLREEEKKEIKMEKMMMMKK
jgi:hypothetical protein